MEYILLNRPDPALTLVEQVFLNRGIQPEDIEGYLNPSETNVIDATLLDNMDAGVAMLIKHISNNDKIFLLVDVDCDGYTSAAALLNYLFQLFPYYVENNVYYYSNPGKMHGIQPADVPEDVKLVICPDSSSNSYEELEILAGRGIDVLILDHHEAEYYSEHACVINNQMSENYENKTLSGVGVVYKFCSRIDELLGCNHSDHILDLTAIGMIGDMMDIRNLETKYLIEKGLSNLENIFLKRMRVAQDYPISRHGAFDPYAVSFFIVPPINATIRVGTAAEKMILFEAMLDFKALNQIPSTKRGCKGQYEAIVDQAVRNCTNIRNRQQKERDKGIDIIEGIIQEKNLLDNKILAIKLNPTFAMEKTITGLMANQLMAKYQRPVLLLNQVVNDEGVVSWEGSARGYSESSLTDFRQFLLDSPFGMYAQGHANAFGFGILDEQFEDFIAYCNEELKDLSTTPCHRVDMIYQGSSFPKKAILKVAELKSVWGQNIPEPMIAVEHINITDKNIQLLSPDKKPTLKIALSNGVELIKFDSSQEEYESLLPEGNGCITINVIATCGANVWGGTITPQLMVKDFEVVNAQKYYF